MFMHCAFKTFRFRMPSKKSKKDQELHMLTAVSSVESSPNKNKRSDDADEPTFSGRKNRKKASRQLHTGQKFIKATIPKKAQRISIQDLKVDHDGKTDVYLVGRIESRCERYMTKKQKCATFYLVLADLTGDIKVSFYDNCAYKWDE